MIGDWTHRDYPLLLPRPDYYPVTVRTVNDVSVDERQEVVESMATSTWSAWSLHHSELRTRLAMTIRDHSQADAAPRDL